MALACWFLGWALRVHTKCSSGTTSTQATIIQDVHNSFFLSLNTYLHYRQQQDPQPLEHIDKADDNVERWDILLKF